MNIINTFSRSCRGNLRDFGFALVIIGIPVGMYLNHFVCQMEWSTIVLVISLLLIPNWTSLLNLKFPSGSKSIVGIIAFMLLSLFYYVICPPQRMEILSYVKSNVIPYILFTIVFSIECCTLRKNDINMSHILRISWVLSIITTFCSLICILNKTYNPETMYSEGELSALTMGLGCVISLICSLFNMQNNPGKNNWMNLLGVLLSLFVVAWIGKRTPFLLCMIVLIIYIWKFSPLKKKSTGIAVMGFFSVLAVILLISPTENLMAQLDTVIYRSTQGISDMFNGTKESGNSASMRYYARKWAVDFILNNFNLFNAIFGYGFMVSNLDIPSLQSYLDMGIIGFLCYNIYVVGVPIYFTLFSKYKDNPYVLFAAALCYYQTFATINSGFPYAHVKWCPVVFLLLVVNLLSENTSPRSNKLRHKNIRQDNNLIILNNIHNL